LPVFYYNSSDRLVVKGVSVIAELGIVLEVFIGLRVEFVAELEGCQRERGHHEMVHPGDSCPDRISGHPHGTPLRRW